MMSAAAMAFSRLSGFLNASQATLLTVGQMSIVNQAGQDKQGSCEFMLPHHCWRLHETDTHGHAQDGFKLWLAGGNKNKAQRPGMNSVAHSMLT